MADPALRMALVGAFTAGYLTSFAVLFTAFGPTPVLERLGLQRGRAGAGTVALLAVGLLALSHALDQILSLVGLREASRLAEYDVVVAAASQATWPWLLLGLVIGPGIGEELLFRGILQRALARWIGRAGAVVGAAAAFGVIHGDPVHSSAAFFMGLYLGVVAELTGGTRAAIACHVVNNLVAVGGAVLLEAGTPSSWFVAAAEIGAAALILLSARRLLGRSP